MDLPERLPIHPVFVADGVSPVAEGGVVVRIRAGEATPLGHDDAVLVPGVVGEVAGGLPDGSRGAGDHDFRRAVRVPSARCGGWSAVTEERSLIVPRIDRVSVERVRGEIIDVGTSVASASVA